MQYAIEGDNFQVLDVTLAGDEMMYSEAGALIYMSDNVVFVTDVWGGYAKGLKRTFIKESFFMNQFTLQNPDEPGHIGFGGHIMGKIIPMQIMDQRRYVLQKGAFLCAEKSVNLDIAFIQKIGAGIFGGEGFVFQHLSGKGTAFIKASGDLKHIHLDKGERIRIDTGLVVGFEESVKYNITRIKGMRAMLFGGEGMFLTTLEGEGDVILQTFNMKRFKKNLKVEMEYGS